MLKPTYNKDWAVQPNPAMMMDVEKMVNISIKGLLKDKPELKPAIISVIQSASRIVPGLLLTFGNREFKKFKATQQ